MELKLSDGAVDKVKAKGGEVVVDFIAPVGCGKVSEVSVSTNIDGRNISTYTRLEQDGVTVYIAKNLNRYVRELDLIVVKGLIGSKLEARTPSVYGTTC